MLYFFTAVDIIPAIQEYSILLIEQASGFHTLFNKNKKRLEVVRKERIAKYKNLTGNFTDGEILEDGPNVQKDIDLFSDAGSQTSTTTSTR